MKLFATLLLSRLAITFGQDSLSRMASDSTVPSGSPSNKLTYAPIHGDFWGPPGTYEPSSVPSTLFIGHPGPPGTHEPSNVPSSMAPSESPASETPGSEAPGSEVPASEAPGSKVPMGSEAQGSVAPGLPPTEFCCEIARRNCTLCAPYRSLGKSFSGCTGLSYRNALYLPLFYLFRLL